MQAACLGLPDEEIEETFFPVTAVSKDITAERAARKYCDHCPVQLECLRLSMSSNYGTYAGVHEDARQEMRRWLRRLGALSNPTDDQLLAARAKVLLRAFDPGQRRRQEIRQVREHARQLREQEEQGA